MSFCRCTAVRPVEVLHEQERITAPIVALIFALGAMPSVLPA